MVENVYLPLHLHRLSIFGVVGRLSDTIGVRLIVRHFADLCVRPVRHCRSTGIHGSVCWCALHDGIRSDTSLEFHLLDLRNQVPDGLLTPGRVHHFNLGDAAVPHPDDTMRKVLQVNIVRHHHHRHLVLGVEGMQQPDDKAGVGRVQVAGGLIQQQEGWHVGDGTRDGDALLLTARQLRGEVVQPVSQSNSLQTRCGSVSMMRFPRPLPSANALRSSLVYTAFNVIGSSTFSIAVMEDMRLKV